MNEGADILHIIVIDDENATRASIIRLIKKINSEFIVVADADNGHDGMLLIKSLLPDVVITDIMMPRLNGFEMIENARICSPKTKYLILSGYAEFELAKQAIRLSVVDYLLKPITADQLSEALNTINKGLNSQTVQKKPETTVHVYSPIVEYIVTDILKNYAKRLYLEEYAEQIKVTPEYAGSLFSKETVKSFSTFLRDVRMEKAKEFIKNTDDRIYEIAYKTGYSDPKYFCKVFKKYTGVSAKSYARSCSNAFSKE